MSGSRNRTRNRVNGGESNAALTPNRGGLIVGDNEAAAAKAKMTKELIERAPFGSYMVPALQRHFKAACVMDGIEIQQALEEAVIMWLDRREKALRDL